MNPKPVVVGVHDKQPTAVRFAVEEATARQRPIHVVHCVEPPRRRGLPGAYSLSADATRHTAGQRLLDAAREVIEHIQADQAATYRLVQGSPTAVLEDEASRATLLVVGTDSAGWAERLFGGRVAAHLAKRSPTPVAIVPEQSWPSPLTGGVFVALQTGTLGTSLLKFAFDEASDRGKELTVIHAVSERATDDEVNEECRRMAIQLSGWSDKFPNVNVTQRVIFDDAGEGCLRASVEAELLILGRSAGRRVNTPWSHPVLAQFARRAHCPCIVVPLTPDEDLAPHEFGGYHHTAPF